MGRIKAKIRLGFVGAGFMGQVAHLANYRDLEGCEIAALAELREDLREAVAERYGIRQRYATHVQLLKDADVDAVIAITPRSMTFDVARDCLTAGKHLFTEKPMALGYDQARELVGYAKKRNLTYAVGFMRRYDTGMQRVKSIFAQSVKTGRMGQEIFVRCHCFGGYNYGHIDGAIKSKENIPGFKTDDHFVPSWVPPKRRRDYARFLNVYCHNINLIRYILARPFKVDYVNLKRPEGGVVVLNADGLLCVLELGQYNLNGWSEMLEIYFTEGHIKAFPPPALLRNVSAALETYDRRTDRTLVYGNDFSWAFRRQAEAFVGSLLSGGSLPTEAKECLEDMKIIEQIWKYEVGVS
ncbi:MAG: Gfo/Idh/MocA family oxidoreductase [Candidatus Omnitrophica bacterium]|nr:Gfo/Idh/MocA family oxidoreductase [Candidatus Omnitrophota bacterium]